MRHLAADSDHESGSRLTRLSNTNANRISRFRDPLPVPLAGSRAAYHFSIDDVFDSLIDASDNYVSLFEQPLLGFLRQMHERHDIRVDLYVFNQGIVSGRLRTLSDVSSRFREQFQNADWLRFGPHGRDYGVPPHSQSPAEQQATFEQIYYEIDRFAGPEKNSRWNRLHYFSECYELAPYFKNRGSDVLLLTDKPAIAYRLHDSQRDRLRREGRLSMDGLHLLQSHYRLEFFERDRASHEEIRALITKTVREQGYLSLFTHEVDLRRESVRSIAEISLRIAASIAQPADVAPTRVPWAPKRP